jgi:putative transposase
MSRVNQKIGNRVHNLNYYFVWCSKYRRKVLIGEIQTRGRELIAEKVKELEAEIIALEIMPDHVHLFISCAPDLAPSYIVNQVK